ncbi:hypothetical protein [Desulfosporosinus sp. OT]|uniref:hypothetical protein n=1 Tax=Desulfosporosinus sp. OT TaxID=913865 RepID=UPI000223A8DD|nr:hypothetical protein [Desulfosporosinus sp. OT]EGW39797.1 hypothetical protein DOT_2013 [Desulfosporosinus sp. OT]
MNSVFYSLIGVLVGSFISWNSLRLLNKKKLRMDIEIKVVDQISDNIVDLHESLYKLHKLTEDFFLKVSVYINKNYEKDFQKEHTYQLIKDCDDEIYIGVQNLIDQYEDFSIYVDIKEIVIMDSSEKISNLHKAFWRYVMAFDDLSSVFGTNLYKSQLIDSIKEFLPKEDFSEILREFESTRKELDSAYEITLTALQSLNEELLNKVYGHIFDRKRNKKIYEVSSGKLYAVEELYTEEKAKQIYKNNRIKRKFKSNNLGSAG